MNLIEADRAGSEAGQVPGWDEAGRDVLEGMSPGWHTAWLLHTTAPRRWSGDRPHCLQSYFHSISSLGQSSLVGF